MAKLYITEHMLQILNNVPVLRMPPLRSQTVSISGVATSSNPFGPNTEAVRLESDTPCSFEFDGVATTSSARMGTGKREYFAVTPGDSVSVIQNT